MSLCLFASTYRHLKGFVHPSSFHSFHYSFSQKSHIKTLQLPGTDWEAQTPSYRVPVLSGVSLKTLRDVVSMKLRRAQDAGVHIALEKQPGPLRAADRPLLPGPACLSSLWPRRPTSTLGLLCQSGLPSVPSQVRASGHTLNGDTRVSLSQHSLPL